MDNAGFYDHYDRSGPKVFVGEYAVTNGAGKGNLMAALGEAAFMTGLERNADVVKMASYAPLFVNDNDRKWNPDAIVFNHAQSYGTPSYYAQKMFASNKGDIALPVSLNMPDSAPKPAITGGIGLGAWNTEVEYDDVQVTSGGKTLFADSFDGKGSGWHPLKGNWTIDNGVYKQSEQITDARSTVIGDWSDYTITLRARKTAGAEGMLIMFGVKDPDNYYWWNIGGWNNTRNVIEKSVGGAKSIVGTSIPGSVETDRWYQIKIVVEGMRIRCYLDGQLVEDVTDTVSAGPLYYTASLDRSAGDIILKMVNVSGQDQAARISLAGVPAVASEAEASVMTADYPEQENDFADPDKVVPITKTISGIGNDFEYMFPKYSITVLRIQMKKD
jgi:alpha-L-arabinofuranosidase